MSDLKWPRHDDLPPQSMDIHIDISATDARFGLFAGAGYELTCGGISLAMSADQFQQLCDNLRPWIVGPSIPDAVVALPLQWRHNAQGCSRKDAHAAGTWRSCARELEAVIAKAQP